MDQQSLNDQLAGLPVPQIRYDDVVGSTNDVALAWLADSADAAQDGCLVIADRQENGRGRLGRRWVTRPGAGLAFSLIVRPSPHEVERLAGFSPLGAMAVSQALETAGLAPQIKWPNDVLLNGRKTAGILVELSWTGEQLQGLVIGIGVNVSPESVPPAGELLFPATSVAEAAGRPVDRMQLLRDVLESLFAWRARLLSPEFLQAWEQRLAFRGEMVRVEETGRGSIIGQVAGIDSSGSLLLRAATGEITAVTVGDVHLRPLDPIP